MKSLKGHFLLAAPGLVDENFYRSVVLMISHDAESALGVIINRCTEHKFAEMWSAFTGEPCDSEILVHYGGPVPGPPFILHANAHAESTEVLAGVYLASGETELNRLLEDTPDSMRLFSGYAGWGPGQLDSEYQEGGWLSTPANSDHVFSDDVDLWKTIAAEIGRPVLKDGSGEDGLEFDPTLN